MEESEICLDFIKNFYWITVTSDGDKMIIFHDCLEVSKTNKLKWIGAVMGVDIFLIWDKAEKITTINIDTKDNVKTISAITKSFKNPQTFSFIKYLIDSFDKRNRKVSMPLEEIKEEFPSLYFNETPIENPIFFSDIIRDYA
jgi:hypothetical protein